MEIRLRLAALVVLGLAALAPALAAPVIVNGSFESGFTGWTRADQIGSEGSFVLQSGTTSPVNGDPVPAPPNGSSAAMTDAFGPGAHVLYQDFVASPGAVQLRFDLFIGNRGPAFFTPVTLDFATPALNQQVRVDILHGGTDPFSVAAADVLQTLYATTAASPLVSGYFTVAADIGGLLAANAGQTLRLRFAETDNVFSQQLGVDDIRIAALPEPSSALLLGGGLVALGWARARTRRNRAAGAHAERSRR